MNNVERIVDRCQSIYEDLDFSEVLRWKEENGGAPAIGYMPTYVPCEIIHASGMLPVGVLGGGERVEIIRGDAYFQSYICRIPRSTIELGVTGKLDCLDGMIFPSICDVIRNLSGMWKLLFKDKYVHYFDVPQNYDPNVGGHYYVEELTQMRDDLGKIAGCVADEDRLRKSIALYNKNRALVGELYDLRSNQPWVVPTSEAYLLLRAGTVLSVEEHNSMLREYLDEVVNLDRKELDNSRIILVGAFCEQPPLGLIKTLERAGCYIVDDDFMLVSRWFLRDVPTEGDPIQSLVDTFLNGSIESATRYTPDGGQKGKHLLEAVKERSAEGVIFAAPSFCDPALLDRPMLQTALREVCVPFTGFKYSENTGQLQPIREQAGTFSDSIKLWSEV